MRDVLEAVASGELSPTAAEARLRGYATGEAGRFDAAREDRSGVPEAVLAAGKTTRAGDGTSGDGEYSDGEGPRAGAGADVAGGAGDESE